MTGIHVGHALVAMLGAPTSDSMERAAELMDLIKSPTAIATGVLIVFARDERKKSATIGNTKARARNALLASSAALIITATVVAVMLPLFCRITVLNRGNGVETRLLVYALTFLVALGTVVYVATVVKDSFDDWRQAED